MLAEKSRVAEEEAMLLGQKASEAEHEITRVRLTALKVLFFEFIHCVPCFVESIQVNWVIFNFLQTEEEKVQLERKTREAEQLTARLVDESERRAAEANRLKEELLKARLAEKQAKEKLLEFLSRNYINSVSLKTK